MSRRGRCRRIAGLRHEAVDDAMEDDAVIEALAGELLDPFDMKGCDVGQELDGDPPAFELDDERVSGSSPWAARDLRT